MENMILNKNESKNVYLNKSEIIAREFLIRFSGLSVNNSVSLIHLSSFRCFRQALHDVCTAIEKTKQSRQLLQKATKNQKMVSALFTFSILETEDFLVRKYSIIFIQNSLQRFHNFLRPFITGILKTMKIQNKRKSMQSALFSCVQMLTDVTIKPKINYFPFIINLPIVYCCNNNDLYINELGSAMLLSVMKIMSKKLSSYLEEITNGLRLALSRGNYLVESNCKNCQAFVINILKCVKIVGMNFPKSEKIAKMYQSSVKEIVILMRYIGFEKSTVYTELVDIFLLLLNNRKITEDNWQIVLIGCLTIIDQLTFTPKVRMKTLEMMGQAICKRPKMWKLHDFCCHTIIMLMSVLCNPPEYDLDAVHALEFDYMPTPISVAADVLHYMAIKLNGEMVATYVLDIIFRTIDHNELSQWEHRGRFLSIGRIVKGCGEYLNSMQNNNLALLFKNGLSNESLHVRDAAIYALHKVFVYLGAKVVNWAKEIFPAMLQNLEFFIDDFMRGMSHHPWHIERMFAVMQMYCCFLDRELSNYLPSLMSIVYSFLCDIRERRIVILTIKMLQKIVYFVGEEFTPYLNSLFAMFYSYIMYWDVSYNNEVRPYIVDFLTYLLCASHNILDYACPRIITLVFNMLQLQKVRIDLAENYIAKLTEYSYLRSSIFHFFHKLSNVMHNDMSKHLPKILGTLLGTISVIGRLELGEFQTELEIFYYKPEDVNDLAIEDSDPNCFLISDGNEIETGKLPFDWDSPVLIEEVLHAAIALKGLIKNCLQSIEPYLKQIFNTLGQALRCDYVELRKHAAYIMNTILKSLFDGEQHVNFNVLDHYLIRLFVVLQQESNLDVWIQDIESLLYCLAVEEKFFKPNESQHAFLVDGLTEMLGLYGFLQEKTEYIATKTHIFNDIVDFMPILSASCVHSSFSNYFGAFLRLFEIRLAQTINVSPTKFNQERTGIYCRLIEYFHLIDKRDINYFLRIEILLVKALDDPCNIVRENAVTGLGSLIEHYVQQPIEVYKKIIKILLKTSKRERAANVLDSIVYVLTSIVRRNLWQLPMHKLFPEILRLLPLRLIFNFNVVIVELIEILYREMPEVITPYFDDTFKFLALQVENSTNDDLNPLRKKALTLASNIYANHYEDLRNVAVGRDSMQAIVAACKNKALINMR